MTAWLHYFFILDFVSWMVGLTLKTYHTIIAFG